MKKLRTTGRAGHVARMGTTRNAYKMLGRKTSRDLLEDPSVNMRIILKQK
jgi:hypothetical protein